MSKRIKGITIELDGSTTGLQKALEDVNKKSRDVSKELRDIERSLKFNPGNATLIAQQQRALAEQVENTSEKLKRLKDAQADVDKQFAEGKINQKQYDAFQREIIETESRLKHFEGQLATSQSKLKAFGDAAVETGEKMKSAGDKMTSIGKDLSMKVTAPIVAVGVASAKLGMDFEAQMSRVGAISQATAAEMDQLSEAALRLGADTSKSASEVAIGMEDMAAMGFNATQILAAMPGVIAASEAAGSDLATTAGIVASALNAFQMEASEASRIADVLAMTANVSAASVEDMGFAFKYAAPVANSLGVGIEELSATIGIMTNAGLEGSQAGTSLRGGLISLLKPAEKTSKLMDAMGITVEDAAGNFVGMSGLIENLTTAMEGQTDVQKLANLAAIVGTEAATGFLTLMEAGPEQIDAMTNSLQNSAGASAEAAAIMKDNLKGALEELGGSFETAAISIYNNIQPALESIVESVQKVADWFNELSPAAQNTIIAIAGIAAAIGPLLVIAGTLVASLGAIFVAFGTFSGAMAVVTTGAAAATPAVGALAAVISALTGPIGIAIAAIAGITAALVLAYNKVDWFREGVNKVWEFIKSATQKAFEAINKVITAVVKDIVKFVSAQLDKFKAFWEENGKFITEIVKKYFGYIADNIKLVMGVIKGIFQTVWPIISGIIEVAWGVIKTIVSSSINLVLGIIQTVLKVLQGDWQGAWTTIQSTAVKIVSDILKFFRDVDLLQIGKDMIQGLIDGIGSMASAVVDRVKGVVNGAIDAAKNLLGIKSPSRVFMQIGDDTGQGFIDGLRSMARDVSKASDYMVGAAIPTLPNIHAGSVAGGGRYGSSQTASTGPVVHQQVVINSPKALSPSETARLQKRAAQELALGW